MSYGTIRPALHQLLRLLIGSLQIATLCPMQSQFVRSIQRVGIKSERSLASIIGPQEHRLAASGLTPIMVVAKSECQPCRWVSGIKPNGLLQHSDGLFVGLGIVWGRDASQEKIVGLLVVRIGRHLPHQLGSAKRGTELTTRSCSDLRL